MLVVISIIAVLAALLLPAINMAREAARRASCSNNLKNLHLAVQQFDQAKGYYPASRTFWNDANYKKTGNHPTTWSAGPASVLTWVHEIMPYIERSDMRSQVEAALMSGTIAVPAAAYGKLAIVFCPSDELDDATSAAVSQNYSQLSYACNSGVMDVTSAPPAAITAITGFDWPQNGVLDNRLKGTANTEVQKIFKTTLGDLTNGDGPSYTIMFAENSDLEEWNYAPAEYHVGVVWDETAQQLLNKYPPPTQPGIPANTKPGTFAEMLSASPPISPWPMARPASQHPTGFMVAFCGGNIKFVSESIDYTVYARLMTSNGKKYLPAGQNPSGPFPTGTPIGDMRSTQTTPPLKEGDY